MSRSSELATLAIRRHEATGLPLMESIAWAIRQALEEAAVARPGADLIGQVVAPYQLDRRIGLASGTAYSRLRKAVRLGHAKKERRGRYRILGDAEVLLAPPHPGREL